jgi:hypothetical protein
LIVLPITIIARDTDDVFEADYFRNFGVRRIGLLNAHFHELGKFVYTRVMQRRSRNPADIARVNAFFDDWSPRRRLPPSCSARRKARISSSWWWKRCKRSLSSWRSTGSQSCRRCVRSRNAP